VDEATGTIRRVLELWGRVLKSVESEDTTLIDREIDWAIKKRMLERYMDRHGMDLHSPRVAQLDLAYHDIDRRRGLYNLLERSGLVERVASDIEVFEAKTVPPQTTRAKLRGDFVRRAQERHRDFTVDWVHLKLNDQAQRTVLCKDPFAATDERVERLIASM
jgi:proteasome accessory factor A